MKKAKLFACLILCFILWSQPILAENETTVSTLFFYTDIREAITEIVLQTGVNIIVDNSVRGVITLDLENVPLEKALSMILLGGGYSYRKIDDYYLVGMADPKSASFYHLAETKTFPLQYISATEARDLLPSFYDAFLRTNRDLDKITITAPSEIITRFSNDLNAIDRRSQQLMIQAIVTEVSMSALSELGLDSWSLSFSDDQLNPTATTAIGYNGDVFNLSSTIFGQLLSKLRIMEGQQKAEIIANPSVVVDDRGTAKLFSGETQYLIMPNTTGAGSHLERVNVGVSLLATPRISNSNEIKLKITPEVSHYSGNRLDNTGFSVRRNEVSTTVYAQNGQTLVLAGMTLEQQSDQQRRVPLIGSIPILRYLFSHEAETKEERELLIFITVDIL